MKLPHIHVWIAVNVGGGLHRYYQCRCGKRRVRRGGCCQPIAQCWLDGGDAMCGVIVPAPKPVPPANAKRRQGAS